MLPVLFHVPGAALFVLVAAIVAGRAVLFVRDERREGRKAGLVAALRADWITILLLGAAAVVVWRLDLVGPEGFALPTYGVLVATAFVAGIWLAQREARRRGQDAEKIADLAFWVLLAALAGSRVYFIAVNWGDYFGPGGVVATRVGRIPRLFAFWEGGLVFYGGFIAATLTALWYMRRHRMPFLAHADTLVPSVAFGHFLGRLGCFAAGCCWGEPAGAHAPFAARFPPASLAYQTFAARPHGERFLAPDRLTTVPLHPVQLYEAFGELALFALLVLVVRPRKRFHGQVLATWLLLYAVLRTVVEVFRGDVERGVWAGLGAGQWTSIAIFAAGAALWARARRTQPLATADVVVPARRGR